MRAREPDESGFVDRDGVRVHYETYGDGPHPIVFTPADTIVDSRMWKAQVAHLARHHRVVVIDSRGNGQSDRPVGPEHYSDLVMVGDLIAVLDATGVDRALLVGLCDSAWFGLLAAARHPDRVTGVVALGPSAAEGTPPHDRGIDTAANWTADLVDPQGWQLYNEDVWRRDWTSYAAWFFSQICNDPHSTKIYEDVVGWAGQTTGDVMVSLHYADFVGDDPGSVAETFASLVCPVLVVQGTHDMCGPFARGVHIARLAGGELLVLGGAGHLPQARYPVVVNLAISEFAGRVERGEATRRSGPLHVRFRPSTLRDTRPPEVAPGATGEVEHDGVRLAWQSYGAPVRPDDPAILLLGGGTSPEGATRATQVALLAPRGRVLTFGSHEPSDPSGPTEVAPWALLPVLETAGVQQAVLVGAADDPSAVRLVTECPDRVAAWLAIDPAAPEVDQFFDQPAPGTGLTRLIEDLVGGRAAVPGRVPVVVVSGPGDDDRANALAARLEEAGATHVLLEGEPGPRPRPRTRRRPPRVLYLSSPIGLGHVRRDLAIADELRRLHPGLQVDWLSQSPVTDFLEGAGERVHPASRWLASESGHVESEAGEHDLHAFQAVRRMDEILVANFMVFDELVRERDYDLWIGDEAWDLDHFLHESPGLKRAPFAWMTDFVGWMPMPDGGAGEALLTADYNAEMVEHVDRHPGVRDRSVFVGDPEDLVPGLLGPGLPAIRDWTLDHFDFSGYVMGERPDPERRRSVRAGLGYEEDEVVVVASVGGSRVGAPLLRRIIDAHEAASAAVPGLRLEVVTGPRLDPGELVAPPGVRVHGFLPDLDLRHAVCDAAVVQGGLSTTMELTANGRPFLYFPLRHHFEQQVHVRHRLERHRAGRAMDYASDGPDEIAAALVGELQRELDYVAVPTDGAAKAAQLVGELL